MKTNNLIFGVALALFTVCANDCNADTKSTETNCVNVLNNPDVKKKKILTKGHNDKGTICFYTYNNKTVLVEHSTKNANGTIKKETYELDGNVNALEYTRKGDDSYYYLIWDGCIEVAKDGKFINTYYIDF